MGRAFHVQEGNRMKEREKVGGLFGIEMGVIQGSEKKVGLNSTLGREDHR